MDELTFIETQAQKAAQFNLDTLELMNKRAHALLAGLLAGAGATGSYALGQLGKADGVLLLYVLGAVSLWWFALAAWLTLSALQSKSVRAPANSGKALLEYWLGPLQIYFKEIQAEGGTPPSALTLLREGELKKLAETAAGYLKASTAIAGALDFAYRGAVCSPLAALLGWAAANLR